MIMEILRTEGLTKRFGALTAVNQVDLLVEEGEVHSIIGPNGAGKTTLFNMLAGQLPPTSGKIWLKDQEITGWKPFEISHAGIGRSYQVTNIFPVLSIKENVRLGVQSRTKSNFSLFRKASSLKEVEEKTLQVLEEVGLTGIMNKKASEVSYGDQRALEIAIALATSPQLLLLDEPTSGMPHEGSFRVMDLIKQISKGLTIVLIEHRMHVVMTISDIITVMAQGKVIAEGPPAEVRKNEEVIRAYLGSSGVTSC
jgi:branched-chain amino acid transport system ATP-binding protein